MDSGLRKGLNLAKNVMNSKPVMVLGNGSKPGVNWQV